MILSEEALYRRGREIRLVCDEHGKWTATSPEIDDMTAVGETRKQAIDEFVKCLEDRWPSTTTSITPHWSPCLPERGKCSS
jgi:hypothetical protein